MQSDTQEPGQSRGIYIADDVRSYILQRGRDFRVCTSCGGPILLPTTVKPPKATDLQVPVGDHTIYISKYQARYVDVIRRSMIPLFFEDF